MVDFNKPFTVDGKPCKLGSEGIHRDQAHVVAVDGSRIAFIRKGNPKEVGYHEMYFDIGQPNYGWAGYEPFDIRNINMIDVTKPLEFFHNHKGADAPFITLTSEGHILVGQAEKNADIADVLGGWAIFTTEGVFVRSGNGYGKALTLRNKPEEITNRFNINVLSDGKVFFSETDVGSDCALQVTTKNGKVIRVLTNAKFL